LGGLETEISGLALRRWIAGVEIAVFRVMSSIVSIVSSPEVSGFAEQLPDRSIIL